MSNKQIALDYFEMATRDVAKALASFAPDAEFITPIGRLPLPGGVEAYLEGFRQSFPDSGFDIENVVEQGDQVAVEGYWFGTNTGSILLPDGGTLPATNRHVRAPFVTFFTIQNGKLKSHRGYWDMAGFMRQLGLGG